MKHTPFLLLFMFLVFNCVGLKAQIKTPELEAGMQVIISDGPTPPFWLMSNRQGKFLPEQNAAAFEAGLFAAPDKGKVFDHHFGLEVFGRQGSTGDVWLHQIYAGITWRDLIQVRAGRWEETVGSREPHLSTGSVIWSGNARPMTKVQIGTPDYIEVPYLRGYVEIKGLLSHGWFEEERYASDVWLHHKNIYFRLGGNLPVNAHYGFNHYAQWGGSSPRQEEPYPSDLDAFYRVFFNRGGDPDDPATPAGWAINKYGNTLGSRDYGINIKLENIHTGIYLQDVFEDRSGLTRKNFPDGLWGGYLRFTEKQKPVQALVYEFLYTKHQSGPNHNDPDGNIIGGNDNYFNHGHYQSGWTLYGFTIGTPLITSPILNDPADQRIINNRLLAHHLGLEGFLGTKTSYRGLVTYSRNYGRHSAPFEEPLNQLNTMLEITQQLPWLNLATTLTVARDVGKMYGDNWGVMVGVRR